MVANVDALVSYRTNPHMDQEARAEDAARLLMGFLKGKKSTRAFVRLPLTALAAYVLFAEVPTIWTWLGGAVIFGSTAYITHREIKAAAADAATAAAAEDARATS